MLPSYIILQISSCDVCQKVNRKVIKVIPEMHPVPVRSSWFHVGMDFIGPISPQSNAGNKYILTLSDYFTKFVEAIALPNKSASGVAVTIFKVCI